MYGQIHEVVKALVENKYGDDTWARVLEVSQLDGSRHFSQVEAYPDSVTMSLFSAVSSVVGISLESVLLVFGEYFLSYLATHGYDKMLGVLGTDFVSFIQNLDSLHSLLCYSFKDIMSPSFRCFEREDGSLILHYYSVRKGLHPIVKGILQSAGQLMFDKEANITVVSEAEEEIGQHKRINHVIMQVEMKDLPKRSHRVSWALGSREELRHCQDLISFPVSSSSTTTPDEESSNDRSHARGTQTIIRAEDFSLAFPYHMVLDRLLCIYQCGQELARMSLVPVIKGTPLREVGVIVQPMIHPTLDNIVQFINSVFILAIHRSVTEKPLILKGSMMWMSHCSHLLFVGSPRLQSFDDLKEKSMFLSDLPLYDVTRDLVLLNQQRTAEMEAAKHLNVTQEKLKEKYAELEEEKKRRQDLLNEILPPQIASKLMDGVSVLGEKFRACTVLFSDVVMFTDMASKCRAEDLIHMLNDMFGRFDAHTDIYGVFKVETIGDAYMAVTGAPNVQENHAQKMAEFAMDMLSESGHVKSPSTGQPIRIRVGIHTGPVVAGVVGKQKPTYDLYGATVNITSRIEGTGAPGRIHVSKATFKALYPYGYEFLLRGPMHLGERGMTDTYFLIGSSTRKVPQPFDRFSGLSCVVNPYPREYPTPTEDTLNDTLPEGFNRENRRQSIADKFRRMSIIQRLSSAVSEGVERFSSARRGSKVGFLPRPGALLHPDDASKPKTSFPRRHTLPAVLKVNNPSPATKPDQLPAVLASVSEEESFQSVESLESEDNPYFGRHADELVEHLHRQRCAFCVVQ